MKRFIPFILLLVALFLLPACEQAGIGSGNAPKSTGTPQAGAPPASSAPQQTPSVQPVGSAGPSATSVTIPTSVPPTAITCNVFGTVVIVNDDKDCVTKQQQAADATQSVKNIQATGIAQSAVGTAQAATSTAQAVPATSTSRPSPSPSPSPTARPSAVASASPSATPTTEPVIDVPGDAPQTVDEAARVLGVPDSDKVYMTKIVADPSTNKVIGWILGTSDSEKRGVKVRANTVPAGTTCDFDPGSSKLDGTYVRYQNYSPKNRRVELASPGVFQGLKLTVYWTPGEFSDPKPGNP